MRLRLVVGDAGCTPSDGKDVYVTGLGGHSSPVEICVRLHIDLTYGGGGVPVARMDSPAQGLRISSPVVSIDAAVEAWLSNLAARGKKPNTITAYRALLESSAPQIGWRNVADITPESLSDWMAVRRESGEWKGVTLNRNLSAFKSLTLFLTKHRWISSDPLACLDRAEDDGAEGSRAATLDEARALIRYAWERQQLDRRCRGDRALVWTCCFLMGLRAGEPEKLQWSHILLDEEIPVVRWSKSINKNRKQQEVVIAPEAVRLLLAHREKVPHGPNDMLFPVTPPRHTFNTDRDNSGIVAVDSRGRRMTTHGMRKWLATTLTANNVHSRVIDRLMRHAGGVQARYADISFADQLAATKGLPALHPQSRESFVKKSVDALTPAPDTGGATPMNTHTLNPVQPARPGVNASVSQPNAPTWRADSSGLSEEVGDGNSGGSTPKLGSNQEPDAVADLLDAVARLLRKGKSDGNRAG